MKSRIFFIICTAIALGGIGLDFRSASRSDVAGATLADGYGVGLATHSGRLIVLLARSPKEFQTPWSLHATVTEESIIAHAEQALYKGADRRASLEKIGITCSSNGTFTSSNDWNMMFSLPLWLVAAAAVAPLGMVALVRRRHALRAGCCSKCGYDLRATPERCPECGTKVAQSALI